MDERRPTEIGGGADGVGTVEKRRRADREHFLAHQLLDIEAGIAAGPVADGEVDVLAREIGQLVGGGDLHHHIGVLLVIALEPRHQPFGAEGGRDRDPELVIVLGALQDGAGFLDQVEAFAQGLERFLRPLGQEQRAAGAAEELDPEIVLERADLLAYRGRGDGELFRRLLEGEVARRGLEGPQGIERQLRPAQAAHRPLALSRGLGCLSAHAGSRRLALRAARPAGMALISKSGAPAGLGGA